MISQYFKTMCLCLSVALLHGCGDSSDWPPHDNSAVVAAETAALEVLDVHLEARNNLDPDLISEVNNYPNFRLLVSNWQLFDTYDSYREFEATAAMPNQEASEWDHSLWDEIRVIQSSEDKVHLAVNWSRVNKEGDRFIARPQFYIVTNQNGHWGIQIRSPLFDTDLLANPSTRIAHDAEVAALEVLQSYMIARNNRDSESLAELNHYPQLLLEGVELQIFNTPEDYISYEENTIIHDLDYAEWDHSEVDMFEIIHSSPTKVHLTYTCKHLSVVDECANIEEGLWVVTKVDDLWGILARSML